MLSDGSPQKLERRMHAQNLIVQHAEKYVKQFAVTLYQKFSFNCYHPGRGTSPRQKKKMSTESCAPWVRSCSTDDFLRRPILALNNYAHVSVPKDYG